MANDETKKKRGFADLGKDEKSASAGVGAADEGGE